VPDDPEPAGERPQPEPEAALVLEEHELPDGRYLLAYRRAEHA
jgi:hypothetical protein